MMDGRFDQHFAELFAGSTADDSGKSGRVSLWPTALAIVAALVIVAVAAFLR